MEKIKSILVLCCMAILVLPLAMPFILQLRIFLAKENALERLERQNLQVVRLRNDQIQWTEAGKELLINGRLFDVKDLKKGNDEVELAGIYDDEETAVKQKIEDFWKDQKTRHRILLIKFFHVLGNSCFRKNDWSCQLTASEHPAWPQFLIHPFNDIYLHIPDPPPQTIS